MELVKPEHDPIVNVGIKQSQKEKITELIAKIERYKSINEFVQEAVSNLIVQEQKNETPSKIDSKEQVLEDIKNINIELLKEELLGNHKLSEGIVKSITEIKSALYEYERNLRWFSSDKLKSLLLARNFKILLDSYIARIEETNKSLKLGISENILIRLKNARNQFIYYITAQEV